MHSRTTSTHLPKILAAALVVAACSDAVSPDRSQPGRPSFSFSPNGVTYTTDNGTINQRNLDTLIKGFNPTNPHLGDAIVATFVWTGSATIQSVTDVQTDANRTLVGNTYHLVRQVTAGGVTMATYVATNVRGFPDPNPDPTVVLAVRGILSQPVADGGVSIAAFSGVEDNFTAALGPVNSASGVSARDTVVGSGPISVNAGALAYAVTMADHSVNRDPPMGFTRLQATAMTDGTLATEADFMVPAGATTADPKWFWPFSAAGGAPVTWLATAFSLNAATSGSTDQPPVAAFTSSCSGLSCNFTSTSSDPDGSISIYGWTFGDGGTSAVQNPSHTYAAGGTYTVTLTVTDNQGATNSVSHSVTVAASNQPPVASFTRSCNGLTCSFTSTSSDPDGSIASYSWTFGDGGTSTVANPSHAYAAAGTYTVTLRVTDNQAATSAPASQTLTVSAPNQPPVASFTKSCSGLTCSFTSTSGDPDGSIASYSWTFGDGGTSTTANPSHTYAGGGTYTVTLRVADNQGAQSTTASQNVTVTPPNQPPVVNAGPDQTAVTGLLYTLNASFSDGNNNGPWSYTINWGDGSTSTGTRTGQGSFSVGHTYLIVLPRSFTITVTVRDASGASGSDQKVVSVLLL